MLPSIIALIYIVFTIYLTIEAITCSSYIDLVIIKITMMTKTIIKTPSIANKSKMAKRGHHSAMTSDVVPKTNYTYTYISGISKYA